MCGRFVLISAPDLIRTLFGYEEQPNFPSRYNIAPTQPIAIVRMVDGKRHFALVRWGLLPSWVKDPNTFSLIINARGESVRDKPAFRAAMKYRRCLIPVDGFYEWKATGKSKQPYYMRSKSGEPLAFAGLWESWTGPNGEELETAAIVTTEANGTLRDIHHRMPVIVPPSAFNLWLDCVNVDAETAQTLISPAPEYLLEAYAVSTAVNRTANDDLKLLERFSPPSENQEVPSSKTGTAQSPRRTKVDERQGVLF